MGKSEKMFKVIHRLLNLGWSNDSALVVALRDLAENDSTEIIDEVWQAFNV